MPINRKKSSPRLEIFPERIKYNASAIINQCHAAGVKVACVTKVVCAHEAVARAMVEAGADMLADSRTENLQKLREAGFKGPFMLLRLPTLSRVDEVVAAADYSLNSSLTTLKALSDAALKVGKKHNVIIMVDVGDLREGVWPDKAIDLVNSASKLQGINVAGMGCNLACFGGVFPSETNMKLIVDTVNACRESSGLEIPIICAGNSSGLPILSEGQLPSQVNFYRIGEAIVLGRNVINRDPWPGTRQDTVVLIAEVIEAETKPSMPIGDRGQDAFGETQEFVDMGLRKRVICNVGRQDVVVDGLEPVDKGIVILGGSSDHLIIDVTDSERQIKVGDEIAFYPGYGALLALSTSDYVQKAVIEGE